MTPYHEQEQIRIFCGDVREVLPNLESGSVNCVVTSPPYWGLRDYGIEGQLGLESTPEEYVSNTVEVFREVRRVLRDDGTLWLNLGDSYNSDPNGMTNGKRGSTLEGGSQKFDPERKVRRAVQTAGGLKPKDLVGIPWAVAFALRADGWYLRSDIIWCLSGGTWLYIKTRDGGICQMMVRDMARLDPCDVQLWNGEKWTQLRGMSKSARRGDELELVLRSGERISCTPTHRFPTDRGLLEASEIRVGDVLHRVQLPEPENPRDCAIDRDAAWLAGLYLAEGSRSGDCIQIAGHIKESERWERLQHIAAKFGGTASRSIVGNSMNVRLYGRILIAIIDELVSGRTAKDKSFSPVVWRYSNEFLAQMVAGYLAGDGHWDRDNRRWRLGFTRNYNLERDLRTACARLGYKLTLKLATSRFDGRVFPTFKGELRLDYTEHWNTKNTAEVIEIRKARCREVYDLGVADEPHLFALASGILTHNSKPNPMPESIKDRPTKSHEYLFLLSKSKRYYYNAGAIAEPCIESNDARPRMGQGPNTQYAQKRKKMKMPDGWDTGEGGHGTIHRNGREKGKADNADVPDKKNKRTVWTAEDDRQLFDWLTENSPELLEQFLKESAHKEDVWRISTEPYPAAHFATFPQKLIEPCILAGCPEGGTVLDPFTGSGTTAVVARKNGCKFIGCEINPEYIELIKDRLQQKVLF